MRIGFDGKRAFHNYSGLGNYSRSLIMALMEYYPSNDYSIFTPKPSNEFNFFKEKINNSNTSIITNNTKYPDPLWRSYFIKDDIKKSGLDIFHGLSAELPFSLNKFQKIKKIVTIHDLIFVRFPHLYKKIDSKIYKFKTKKACVLADSIIAISKQTKEDLINIIGIKEEKIKVVYQNAHPLFSLKYSAIEKEKIRIKYGLPKEFLLTVGTIEERKNGLNILKSIKELPDIPIVFIGGKTAYHKVLIQFIQENGMNKRVFFLEKIPQHELPIIYQNARLFIYISKFEGFGIPIVEAIHSNTPLITSNNSSMIEIAGVDNNIVNPEDISSIEHCIQSLWHDDELLSKSKEYNQHQSQFFTDEIFARDTMNVYNDV